MEKKQNNFTHYLGELTKGILKENPLLVLVLGTCPALATTTSLLNGLGMGLAATFVLTLSNLVISLVRQFIPDKVRIPCYITIIAGFVTILQFLLEAYVPALNSALGIFIPLITVNCIILGRAEAYANKHNPLEAVFDGIGMGVGFALALTVIGGIREILGNGSIAGWAIPFIGGDNVLQPILLFIMPPGGFLVFGFVIAIATALTRKFYAKHPDLALEVSAAAAACGCCGAHCVVGECSCASKGANEGEQKEAATEPAPSASEGGSI